ncbi:unnamed protein product [Brassicogethes aeneus]|uniref:Lebercilin domain-containing protein n=1 Tax=Brassicogethes aeneus TaxID=1431903 RepID=A0A9P0B7B8_BRAAE|nr:unnamed protein product [Brassicogethes aeneus]
MTSVASSVSINKTGENSRSKSCDTVCSSSSCFFKRRKPILPYNIRPPPPSRSTGNIVRQRVLSAKIQKVRSLQSQLNDANFHLAELAKENQALMNLQKRQDKALSRYENSNADLPRLLHKHEEEIRNLMEKNKILRKSLKETSTTLKLKDEELTKAKEQLFHLETLNKDKRLIEREKLCEKVDDLQFKLTKSEEQVAQINRRLMLETKNSKHRLNAEIVKNKQNQKEIARAMAEIDRLTNLLETREISPSKRHQRFSRMPNRQSMSLVCLDNNSMDKPNRHDIKAPVSEVRLEPIANKIIEEADKPSFMMTIPSENIKSRLSSGSGRKKSLEKLTNGESVKDEITKKLTDFNKDIDGFRKFSKDTVRKLTEELEELEYNKEEVNSDEDIENMAKKHKEKYKSLKDEIDIIKTSKKELNNVEDKDKDHQENSLLQSKRSEDAMGNLIDKLSNKNSQEGNLSPEDDTESIDSDISTDKKLSKIAKTLDQAIQKTVENNRGEFDRKLGEYCSTVINDVKKCDTKIKTHKTSIKMYKEDTDKLLDSFNEAKSMEANLQKSVLGNASDFDFLNIFNETALESSDKNGMNKNKINNNVMKAQPKVSVQDKDKLLATLRAIDNGDTLERVGNLTRSTALMGELFGDVSEV